MNTPTKKLDIVVAVDGSAPSDAAVDWAAHEAALRKRPLTIVHVVQLPVVRMWPEVSMPQELIDGLIKEGHGILDAARARAEKVIEAARSAARVTVETELVTANVLPTLIEMSDRAELMVVGCRGRGWLGRRLLGSVSRGLLHHARGTVAVIHDEQIPAEGAPIVVGIDGSPASEAATAVAFDAASRRGVELVAVHAWSDYTFYYEMPGIVTEDVRRQAEEILAERLAGWQEQYPDVKVRRVVVMDRPVHQLLEQAEHAQLLVVGSHGRGGFASMLLGSVSTAVAESAHVPVIVARPR
ncbi:universal stress protein [Mycolicibacterium hassiacum DSM 44199]|jgi:nucleotide-binding universal stress UspA family protein|uniref:Universal stress protein n=1 Tax=Mycolicibacterium hassiacum (strain DSM 44199 / CIP 105218 / JCM 12690 / 3849) TaxID=1122247 RepID=K5BF19_MYCHD|nr:universal stress protein [Mycolicibacterium hassiacum]EKF23532.1 universal stress protein [Mycolicibacterium hassiacum DSM 44199]MBX5488545.1 universal stress protein [Mycolicibacterium hassiacum]MDA4084754.1 universal stress protein [Mycolicibacterium hassiacum DSM 44199]VCT89974.1 Universal stress protein [Mycolicibacterium hassiacum DSM 44199]